jgi:hypothetical protein
MAASGPSKEEPSFNKEADIEVETVRSSDEPKSPQSAQEEAWYPGWRAQFPYLGLLGFLMIFTAMGLSAVVLCTSDHKLVETWPMASHPTTPNVFLNLINQISSLGLITAIGQGLAIAWWRKALRGGTLETLHRNHAYSTSFLAVITSGKYFNTIALAALMAKFAVIDSTLYQKATIATMEFKPNYMNATVDAWIWTSWPSHIGGIPGTDGKMRALDYSFGNTITQFQTRIGNGKVHDTDALFQNCPPGQTCGGHLAALGFSYNCSTSVTNIDYGAWRLQNATGPPQNDGFPLWSVNFNTIWPSESQSYTSINLTMLYVNTTEGPAKSCPGTLTWRTCEIRPAVVQYPMAVLAADPKQPFNVTHLQFSNSSTDKHLFSAPMTDSQIDGLTVVSVTDLDEDPTNASTVGAITYSLNNLFQSQAYLNWSVDWDLTATGVGATSEFTANSTDDIADFCDYRLDYTMEGQADPFIALLRQINQFAFTAALYLSDAPSFAPSDRVPKGFQTVSFNTSVKGYVEEYQTNYKYLAGALVATMVTVVAVLPVYWGFWQLGRKVSLAPFDIANAFNAPIFDGAAKKNADVDTLLAEVGQRRVQYGQMLRGNAAGQLGMAEPHHVQSPRNSKISSTDVGKKVGIGAALGAAVAGASIFGKS